jgi:hypothetical protein
MSTYEIINIITSIFTALGTCGATILALFFWYRDDALKLRLHSMHAEGYGHVPNIENGYLLLNFTNTGYKPIYLEAAGIKFQKGCYFFRKTTFIDFRIQNNNIVDDKLPKQLDHGASYVYIIPWDSFLKLCKGIEYRKMAVYAYISSSSKEIKFNLSRQILEEVSAK